jgi:effector-binding domain-containing protein
MHLRRQRSEPILAIRRRGPMDDVPAFFGEAYPRLFAHAEARGSVPSGPPGGRYGDGEGLDHADVVAEAFITVAEPVAGAGDIVADHLPETDLAVALHVGPYDDMRDTYRSIGVWVAEHDRRVTGPLQELYLLGPDPAFRPRRPDPGIDPATFRTEVGWPVTPAPSDQGAPQ